MACVLLQSGTFKPPKYLAWLVAGYISMSAFPNPLANAQGGVARSILTTPAIIEAMQARQLPIRGVQVKFAVPITSTVISPSLEIRDIAPLSPRIVRLRIACQDSSECLPFFVMAVYQEAIGPEIFRIQSRPQGAAVTKSLSATKAMAETLLSPISNEKLKSRESSVTRSGSPATLDFEGERIHVRIEVICLESGATGDKIRVTTPDRKQFYVAEIVTPKELKGFLTK